MKSTPLKNGSPKLRIPMATQPDVWPPLPLAEWADTRRGGIADPVRSRRAARVLRSRVREPLVARRIVFGNRAERIPLALSRQVQSGPFFLGQLRPGRHALQRTPGAGARGRRRDD